MKLPALEKAVARIEALSRRDRAVLLAGLLAGLVAIDVQLVLGMRDRRVAFVNSQAQNPAADQAQVEAAAQAERQARLDEIRKKLEQRHKDLAQQGLSSPPQAIFDELRRTLALPGIQLLELRALPDDADDATPATPPAAAPADPAASAEAPTEAASAPPAAIYRHRTEVRIAGPLPEVSRVVKSFEQPTLPLRLERVRFSAAGDGLVQASFVLLTISQDRTWLAL